MTVITHYVFVVLAGQMTNDMPALTPGGHKTTKNYPVFRDLALKTSHAKKHINGIKLLG